MHAAPLQEQSKRQGNIQEPAQSMSAQAQVVVQLLQRVCLCRHNRPGMAEPRIACASSERQVQMATTAAAAHSAHTSAGAGSLKGMGTQPRGSSCCMQRQCVCRPVRRSQWGQRLACQFRRCACTRRLHPEVPACCRMHGTLGSQWCLTSPATHKVGKWAACLHQACRAYLLQVCDSLLVEASGTIVHAGILAASHEP